jgi:hypothetical protein
VDKHPDQPDSGFSTRIAARPTVRSRYPLLSSVKRIYRQYKKMLENAADAVGKKGQKSAAENLCFGSGVSANSLR